MARFCRSAEAKECIEFLPVASTDHGRLMRSKQAMGWIESKTLLLVCHVVAVRKEILPLPMVVRQKN